MSVQNREGSESGAAPARGSDQLPAAARRALAEAAARRGRGNASTESARPAETGGPQGPEPTRFGDWERKGIASDF